jgi:ribose 5-phosphate isomerase B
MKIALAADHGGFDMKELLIARLRQSGHEVSDFGARAPDPDDDYPDYVVPPACAVAAGKVDRGIVICGTGVGASVAANEVNGIRAGLCHDHYSVRQGVEDDDMNVLCRGGRVWASRSPGTTRRPSFRRPSAASHATADARPRLPGSRVRKRQCNVESHEHGSITLSFALPD